MSLEKPTYEGFEVRSPQAPDATWQVSSRLIHCAVPEWVRVMTDVPSIIS